jgi:uncharacterized protein (TIGR03643 family)
MMSDPSASSASTDAIIRMAWHDRTTFETIREKTGLHESQVIALMRRELKPSSFRCWRKRVSGRVTKHRKRFEARLRGA